jgi:UDP-N-acetyl-2-amino-2-deoxyglucuronate dehydrogenase
MTSQKTRFAFVGCGAIANKHVTALKSIEEASLVGVYDINYRAATMFRENYEIPAFATLEELVEKANPDVFCILTPSGLHGDNILEMVQFGRHFVVEKPLALRIDQIDQILTACDQTGLKVFVVQQNRFNPPVRKLKEALSKGRFGKLVLGAVRVRWCRDQTYYDQKSWRGTWALDGGVLTNQASHHIDMLIWLMGEVESVMSKTATRLARIEAEDTGVAILKFRNGAIGVIEATTATRPKDLEGSISVLGEKGAVEIGGFFMNRLTTWNFNEPDEMDADIWEKYAEVPSLPSWNHTEFYRDVISSLSKNTIALIDGLEGRKSVELINAIYESAETGKDISLRFSPKKCLLGVRP